MDQWLCDTLNIGFSGFSPQLWRGLYNAIFASKCGYGRSCAKQFVHDAIIPYEELFIAPAADEADVIQLVQGLNGKFEWNRFSYAPTEAELAQYLERGGIRVVKTKP